MIKTVKTLFTIKEMTTDGHAPVLFHCDDGNNYYCKYRIWPRPQEINCLAFEIIASVLLQRLKIPTPEVAFVEIKKGTLNSSKIASNKRMKEGMIVFGSRAIPSPRIIDELSIIQSKTEFKNIKNPKDLVRIALFDLWVKNGDRGRNLKEGHNYNLLYRIINNKKEIVAFDHAFIFGNSRNIGDFFQNNIPESGGNLYQTPFYRSVIRHIEKLQYEEVINNFVNSLKEFTKNWIDETLKQIPESWKTIPKLSTKIITLLSDKTRIDQLAYPLKEAIQ